TLTVKFFPEYKALGLHKAYLFNVLVLGFGSLAIALLLAALINRPVLKFLEFLSFDAHLIAKHKYTIVVLIAIMLYNNVLLIHTSNYNKIAIPSAFQNLLPKLILPLLIIGVYLEVFEVAAFARLWVLSYCLASMGLTFYLWKIDGLDLQPKLHFFHKDRIWKLLGYSSYMSAGTLGSMLAGRIDLIMVGTLIGLKEVGIYSIALFIGNVLLIPASAVWQIASPVISEAFAQHNWERITEVYKKTSTNLLIIGVFIYFFILGSLDAVLTLSPNYRNISMAVSLFAIIGITKMIEMGASVNQYILNYSPKFRSTLLFVAIMAITNIVLNYFLIDSLGILGAALSTCITTYLYQLIKCIYIEKQYGIHPLSNMTPRILLLFLIIMLYYLLLPDLASPIVQAIIYCVGLVILYVAGIRLLGIRSDVTETVEHHFTQILRHIRVKVS
ncbi:MAG TPA: polysaccharide biosynthesis C-terminal domain-containing protein, partial [Saprospiraceae bacterium]|nr:polysaccharide biosynthesis C-terminal domain-containing protein [Saprospiraceae bacterium]